MQLANNLIAVLSQALCPRIDTDGMVAAYEFMYVTPGIQNLIRENKSFRIDSEIQTGKRYGMQLLDDNLWGFTRKARSPPKRPSTRARTPAAWSTACSGRDRRSIGPPTCPMKDPPVAVAIPRALPQSRSHRKPAPAEPPAGRAKPSGKRCRSRRTVVDAGKSTEEVEVENRGHRRPPVTPPAAPTPSGTPEEQPELSRRRPARRELRHDGLASRRASFQRQMANRRVRRRWDYGPDSNPVIPPVGSSSAVARTPYGVGSEKKPGSNAPAPVRAKCRRSASCRAARSVAC